LTENGEDAEVNGHVPDIGDEAWDEDDDQWLTIEGVGKHDPDKGTYEVDVTDEEGNDDSVTVKWNDEEECWDVV
jgi:hypothetical protein